MTRELRRVRGDSADRERFHAFVPLTFRSADFRRWDERGGWNEAYEAWLLDDDGETVASIGLTRLRFSVSGEVRSGYQLGAVATHPERRGRGHSRVLMDAVLAHIDAQGAPALLFANEHVLGFYPRFGFRAVAQQRFGAECRLLPATPGARRCDVADPAQRLRLAALCAQAPANDTQFGVCDYYTVLLWHLTYRAIAAFWLDDGDAIAVVERRGSTLLLHDVIARRGFDLAAALPHVIDAPVAQIEFGFSPPRWWRGARVLGGYAGSPLFVRGLDMPEAPLRFPDLAQT